MSENETNPQRQPVSSDAEPSHPTTELPPVAREESGSSDSSEATQQMPAAPAPDPAPAASAAPTAEMPAAPAAPAAGGSAVPASPFARPAEPAPAPVPSSPAAPPPAPSPWQPGHQQQPVWPGNAGYAPGAPAPYGAPTSHGAPAPHGAPVPIGAPIPLGAPVPGQAHAEAAHGSVPPGSAPPAYGPVPPHGQPPIWAHQPGAHAQPRSGRFGKVAALGAAALVLMAGSGIAGGAVALALDDNTTTVNRTYQAAPVLSQSDLPGIAAEAQKSVVSITAGEAGGSGVVLSADGFVLTNNHVVEGAQGGAVSVTFADGTTARASVVGTDPRTDLAVIKASGVSDLTPAKFGDSDAMQIGDTVLALGSPLGLEGSVTSGIVSAKDRTIRTGSQENQNPFSQQSNAPVSSISGLLQTDAAINPGNSGGALVNTKGEVIGINTAIATSGQSNGNIGVGFAIPSNKAKDVADKLRNGEKVSHPSLGVSVSAADGGGALIGSVNPNSAAAKGGLKQGDVITKFGGKAINDSDDLIAAVQSGKVGDQVQVTYTRNGQEQTATVTLAEAS